MDANQRADDPANARALALVAELRVVIRKLRRRVREQTLPGDLTWSQVSVLGLLDREGPSTVTTLARAEGVRPQSMGATVAALEAAGMVTGAPDPDDGRQTMLSVTDACREFLAAGRAARQDWLLAAIHKHLTPGEQEALASALALLARIADS